MEMPINIIVVLFVAIVVGGAILFFSRQTLDNAQQQLADQWRNDPALKDSIVDVDVATNTTVISLANECVQQQQSGVDQKTCFALFAKTWTADLAGLNGTQLSGNFTLDTTGAPATPAAVKIAYDPRGEILVTG